MHNAPTRTRAGRPGHPPRPSLGRNTGLPLLSLVLGLSLLLAACGPTQDAGNPTATPVAPTNTAVAPAAATATTGTAGAGTATTAPGGAATATTGTAAVNTVPPTGKKYVIAILQTATHPALDFTREGVKQAFVQAGFVEGQTVTFDVRNEESDPVTAARMADDFIAKKVDAIVTIGSPASQAALTEANKQKSTIPIIFCAVADPYAAKLAGKQEGDTMTADPKIHPDFLTGVQAFPPVEDGLKLIKEVRPDAKNIGLLWNPGEPNSKATTDEARRVADTMGITMIDRTATKPADTLDAAQGLARYNVDAFFVSTTNSVVAGLDSVVRVAQENKIPLFGNDPLSASRGAVAAQGLDYTQNGLEAGQMAVQIVTGKATVKSLDIAKTSRQSLCINTKAAQLQNVTLPTSLTARAAGCTYTEIKSPIPPKPAAGATPTKAP